MMTLTEELLTEIRNILLWKMPKEYREEFNITASTEIELKNENVRNKKYGAPK